MDYAAARQHMIDSQIKTNKVTDPSVIEALAALPREAFVAEANRALADLRTGRFEGAAVLVP